ncbi:hypothetical protein BDV30DRAFT_219249 [Aspergillus minisclerotigenes]|uniref:Uncharacterized protein n=1 Tax=Aspergillus minisclerotigenes TaxID=656917 RepID=A0A5N6INY0_9EURO|nr:hypothetical protein BDV30DRAFT_219249 [Aspergillus minisclerotigenes]
MERFDTDGFMLEQDIPPYSCHGNTLEAPGIHLSEVSTHIYFGSDEERFNGFWLDYIEAHKDERGASGARALLTVTRLLLLDSLPGSDTQLGLSPEASVLERAIVYIVEFILPSDKERIEFLQEGRITQYLDQPVDPIRLNGLLDEGAVGVRGISALSQVVSSIGLLCGYYAIFETGQGHLGWGPPGISKGDVIGFLFGFEMPVVLRKIDSHYIYIGACYIVGIMDGDPLVGIDKGSHCIKRFNIESDG